ncbi:MAG: ABC transporter substrate-binding protein [Chloroflexota bacterium]
MTPPRRSRALLVLALVAAAACGPAPTVTPTPPASLGPGSAAPTAAPSDVPFAPVAWPANGSACATDGAGGRIGRIEAQDAKTVVFTLCAPDGAFLARLAHPAAGIVDAADLARIPADPAAARDVTGRGAYRVVRWGSDNVELARVGAATPTAIAPTVILRWRQDPAARVADLVAGSVDCIDAPTPDGLSEAATTPSLTVVQRPLLALTVLGFGRGSAFSEARVRRAIAAGIDRQALVDAAFPDGSTPADHLAPCSVPAGCAGDAFRGFNAPSSVATLQSAGFDLDATYTLTIPDAPIPGLADPAGTAAALVAQFAANLGITVAVTTVPAAQFRSSVDAGTLAGMYLDGVAATLPDASAFYNPLFLAHPTSLAARRATTAASSLLAGAQETEASVRENAYAAAADSLRDTVPVAPLAIPGSAAIFQADVRGASASPMGTDPLGAMTAGDRGQIVFEQASPPSGGWCGAQASADADRLCALVTDGLYAAAPDTLEPTPRLASACTPNGDATVWTCRLRAAKTASGLVLDAADVVATFRAMADPADPVHAALGSGAFTAWDALFGVGSGEIPRPSPSPSGSPSASGSPAASGSSAAPPSASASGAP